MFKQTHVFKGCSTCFVFSARCFENKSALAIALRYTGPIWYQCNFTISVLGYTLRPYTQNIPKQLYKWIHLLALPPLRQQQCSQSSDVKPHAPIGFSWLPWPRQPRHIFPLPFQIHPNHLGQIPGHFRQLWTCCQAAAAVWESRDWSSSTSFALRCRSWSES